MELTKGLRCEIEYGTAHRGIQFSKAPFGRVKEHIKSIRQMGMNVRSISITRALFPVGQEEWAYPSQWDGFKEYGNRHVIKCG